MDLKFSRSDLARSRYYADGTAHRYVTFLDGKSWMLQIWKLGEASGIKVADEKVEENSFHESKKLALAVARAYEDLGEDYVEFSGGRLTRMIDATNTGYDAV